MGLGAAASCPAVPIANLRELTAGKCHTRNAAHSPWPRNMATEWTEVSYLQKRASDSSVKRWPLPRCAIPTSSRSTMWAGIQGLTQAEAAEVMGDFVRTYIAMGESESYTRQHMVEDPVAHVRFPDFAAGATLEWQGRKYYFIDDQTRQEFEETVAAKCALTGSAAGKRRTDAAARG
jgi:YHS domain-containing protein